MSTAPPWVDECESLSASRFRRAYFDTGTPVVLRGLIRGWPACATWSLDALARRFPTQTVEVMVCDPDARPTGESPYLERRRLPFAAAVALMGEDGGRRLHLVAQNQLFADPAFGELWADLYLDPDWFDQSATLPGVSLWVSPRHSVTPLHYDLASTLLAQVVGRKRVIFASPADTENLYKGPAGYSTADPEVPARDRYPRLAGARLHQAVLEPGDALFLPREWWHHVRSLEASISLSLRNFAWSSPLSPV
jgi:cupin-like protein